MTTIVDARGLACPQPVIKTRQAMQQADQVVTLVDNEAALTNVSRMAEKAGWQVTGDARRASDYRIEMSRRAAPPGRSRCRWAGPSRWPARWSWSSRRTRWAGATRSWATS